MDYSESFSVVIAEKQTVYVFFPEKGTADEEKFDLLAGPALGTRPSNSHR